MSGLSHRNESILDSFVDFCQFVIGLLFSKSGRRRIARSDKKKARVTFYTCAPAPDRGLLCHLGLVVDLLGFADTDSC